LIGGGEFDPGKCAGSVFFDVGHDAGSVLLGRDRSKRVRGRPASRRSVGGRGRNGGDVETLRLLIRRLRHQVPPQPSRWWYHKNEPAL
jgi:hypothetical protein